MTLFNPIIDTAGLSFAVAVAVAIAIATAIAITIAMHRTGKRRICEAKRKN